VNSKRLWELIKHSLLALVFALVIFFSAVVLSYVKDGMIAAHREEWIIKLTGVIEIALFATEALVIIAVCLIVIKEVILELLGK
jgi:hypothetical protein